MKFKPNQSGYVSLLVTSVLLLIALTIALASSRGIFFQIKVAQNEIKARQAHWKAEGGLECAFTINHNNNSVLPDAQDYSACNLSTVSVTSPPAPSVTPGSSEPRYFEIVSLANNHLTLKKSIKVFSRTSGAIQARSDLMLIGSNTFKPEFVAPDYCFSVRFQTSITLQGSVVTNDPAGNTCNSAYKTNTEQPGLCVSEDTNCDGSGAPNDYNVQVVGNSTDYIGDGKMFENDFIHDPDLDPFESFFGYPRSEIATVKSQFEVIAGSVVDTNTASGTSSCKDLILGAFASNNKVWVVGDCDLENGLGVAAGSSPKVLVVENGILSTYGVDTFPGMVYHLFTSTVGDMTSRWTSDVSGTDHLGSLTAAQKAKLTFISGGSFKPTGGFVFDTVGGLSVFTSSLNLEFDATAIPNNDNRISWLRGSWNDL